MNLYRVCVLFFELVLNIIIITIIIIIINIIIIIAITIITIGQQLKYIRRNMESRLHELLGGFLGD